MKVTRGQSHGNDAMSTTPARETRLIPVSFDDADLFYEWERRLGWDVESTQLSAGANEIRFDHFALPGLLVSNFCSKQSMRDVFAAPDGAVVLFFSRVKLPLVWCGRHVPPTLSPVARSGRENWCVLPAGLDAYEFIISEDLIQKTEIFPPSFFAKTTDLNRACVPLTEPITGEFLRGMDSFFDQARDVNGSPAAGIHQAQFFDFIIDGLQGVIDAGLAAQGPARLRNGRRFDLVQQGRDFVSAHLAADLSADDMARALGVSYRVLNYAFRDCLGLSPYQYILTEKLHSARRQLKFSGASVLDVSFGHRFRSPSRFAGQYARLFGELPSQTRYAGRR
jgi:AraC-like DNA-binding protein